MRFAQPALIPQSKPVFRRIPPVGHLASQPVCRPADANSTRKRIEHAVELFGSCMLIVAALVLTLFG